MDLKGVCRTCLLPRESMLSIFSPMQLSNLSDTKVPIIEFLKSFAKISVSPDDGLPENICCGCLDRVRQSYTFKLKCDKSEDFLKPFKSNKNNPNELIKSNSECEQDTEMCITHIKKERTEDYEISNDEQSQESLTDNSEHDGTAQDTSLVQDIKQEPEIEIHVEDGVFNDTNSVENCFKKYFRCLECTKVFRNEQTLKTHMSIHTGETQFPCKICPKHYRFKIHLTKHMQKSHADGKPNERYKCLICPRVCVSKSQLDSHLRIHTGEKPFHCLICPKSFRLNAILKEHMQAVHADGTENSKFECPLCSKLFGRKQSLHTHMTIHTGIKPYQCEICPSKYRAKGFLKVHMERKHGIKSESNKILLAQSQ